MRSVILPGAFFVLTKLVRGGIIMAEWKESEHPRDNAGKFTNKEGSSSSYRDEVNERIKWAKENNVELPLNNDGSLNDIRLRELWESAEKDTILLPDEEVPRSVGAKWKNYDVLMPDGGISHLAEGSKLQNKEVFAGKGCKRKIDDIDRLVKNYGGKAENWQKVKAISSLNYKGEIIKAEIHWYEESTAGKQEFKYKKRIK